MTTISIFSCSVLFTFDTSTFILVCVGKSFSTSSILRIISHIHIVDGTFSTKSIHLYFWPFAQFFKPIVISVVADYIIYKSRKPEVGPYKNIPGLFRSVGTWSPSVGSLLPLGASWSPSVGSWFLLIGSCSLSVGSCSPLVVSWSPSVNS